MIPLLWNAAWGIIVLLSFVASGRILARLVAPGSFIDAPLAAGWGMAALVALGGWLNLFSVARSPILVALVLAVIFVDLLCGRRGLPVVGGDNSSSDPVPPGRPKGWEESFWIALLVLLVAVKYVTSVGRTFNDYDDQPAYLLQTARMLQTGSIGLDPFSERQLYSLNGQIFLLSLIGSVSPPKYAFLLDPGICWIMLAGLTWSIGRRDARASTATSSLLTGLVLMCRVPYGMNLGGHLTGTVLHLTLVRTAYRCCGPGGKLERGPLFLLALTLAGLCALKSTFLVFAAGFVVVWYGLRMWNSPGVAVLREFSSIGFLVSVLLLPWMWQQYLSGETPLYPFLGRGYHGSGIGAEPYDASTAFRAKAAIYFLSDGQVVPVFAALFLACLGPCPEDRTRRRVLIASLLSVSIGSLALAFMMGKHPAISRYTQPFLFAALIPAGMIGFSSTPPSRRGMALALCLATFVGYQWDNLHTDLAALQAFLRTGPYGWLVEDEHEAKQIREAQAVIPPGKRIVASVQNGFLLDFVRNPIWSLDNVGTTSPPPGIPIAADRGALRDFLAAPDQPSPSVEFGAEMLDYLRHAGGEFLVIQRRTSALSSTFDEIAKSPFYCLRMIHIYNKLAYQNFANLIRGRTALYDDGDMVVLDLQSGGKVSEPRR